MDVGSKEHAATALNTMIQVQRQLARHTEGVSKHLVPAISQLSETSAQK